MTVPASGPLNASIAIVGMAPAREEVATGIPFSSNGQNAGWILDKSLHKLGLSRKDVYVTNIHDEFLAPGTSLFSLPRQKLDLSVARFRTEMEQIHPNVLVALGDEPLYFTCGFRGIQKWRGSILPSTLIPGLKVIPSVHPAWIIGLPYPPCHPLNERV